MNGTQQKIILTISVLAIIVVAVLYATLDKNEEPGNPVNNGLTSLTTFDVDCPEANSSTEGTFFVMQNKDSMSIKIVADLTVGTTDKEGIEFFIPAELDIVNVLCSFNDDISKKYVTIRDWPEGGHFVYFAKARYSPIGTQMDGNGTTIIELHLDKSVKLGNIDSLDFGISVANKVTRDIPILIQH